MILFFPMPFPTALQLLSHLLFFHRFAFSLSMDEEGMQLHVQLP